MACLGFGPADFELFEIDDPSERVAAIDATLQPKLHRIAADCLPGLTRIAGRPLHLHDGKGARRKGQPPEEALVVLCESPRGYRGVPFLAIVVTRDHLHAKVGIRGESPQRAAMFGALAREAGNLSRKGKPFRKLRTYADWNYEELPEVAPAHSVAFWQELSETIAPGGGDLDVGVALTREEARSLSLGDLLGVFRDLAPLYKLLANA
ncbi:MAG: DUF1054 family protein [Anaeromyxobacteraceae bacterium]